MESPKFSFIVGNSKYYLICTLIIVFLYFSFFSVSFAAEQVKVRLYSSQSPDFVIFTVVDGEYTFNGHDASANVLRKNDIIIISKYDNKLAVKPRQSEGFIVDSITFKAASDNSSFSLRLNAQAQATQLYKGDFSCYPDLATIVMINNCNIDDYIAGVVRTEGGPNRHREYIKAQAIITRTYLYKYFNRHISDGYNVCDGVHCQAFHGVTNDQAINLATKETKDMVILDRDSVLILAVFHSNCGGMTATSRNVWVTDLPYLRSVSDPYCVRSRNATWERRFTVREWNDYLQRYGYTGSTGNVSLFNFNQNSRLVDYRAGTFTMPFEVIRSDLGLRSAFFSVIADNNSVTLRGRGYGHGVGLCQEGAMEMAIRGNTYNAIISFYYSDVIITNLKNARSAVGNH